MSIKKLEDGRYEVDIRPTGRNGKRVRRKFDKKFEAVNYERYVMANHSKEWEPKLTDNRRLSEIAQQWWDLFGRHLDHGRDQKNRIDMFCRVMSDPVMPKIDKSFISQYCQIRTAYGVKASTVNREITAVRGIFTNLIDAGLYHCEHPFSGYKKMKEQATEMSYLTDDDISRLLAHLSGDDYNIAVLCLSTGARWSEATRLKREHVIHNKIRFTFTKTRKPRIVPISDDVADMICDGKNGLLFPDISYQRFRKILKEVKPTLPGGQATHVLRHTFATHFMMNGGSILTLQRLLGHANLSQTMTYAHFAPDFLQDAIDLNPLKGKCRI
ncbi:integrase [Morganella morganii]|uniref:Integrase n=1 Tax=Morganella morganii TaxID=582 RepID=A0A8I0PYZ3_MORMO|nr:integrase [Morganella morganii]